MPELETPSLLEPYRVLDLTEGGYLITGKILGDLGAGVVKIEPPEGSPSRNIAPFYKDIPDSEKSLFWFAYNTNKRSITLNLETADGRELFRRLVAGADFILESFEPGYMEGLGLGYEALSQINPRLIMTSITPFGPSGPYSHYRASELTVWAMGGFLGSVGANDRPPVWVGFPQAYLHAGNYAAAASMIAHWHRETTGEGQHVDVSNQQCVVLSLYSRPRYWEFRKVDQSAPRVGNYFQFLNARPGVRRVYQCQDGDIFLLLQGGGSLVFQTSSGNLVKYMAENNMASEWLQNLDWLTDFDAARVTQDVVDRAMDEVSRFLLTKTKQELSEEALKRRILMAPIANAREVYENAQLWARDFWVEVEHPELRDRITYCGPFVQLSEAPIRMRYRPPLIGEHNAEVYGELGISKPELSRLKQSGII